MIIDSKYIIVSLFAATMILLSCHEEKLSIDAIPEEMPSGGTENGDVLNVEITLDNMGGRAYESGDPYAQIENYIDPEKIRVLVFDSNDKFLFESKNRWVKQIDATSEEYSLWTVSIPLSSYGTEEEYDWEWEEIRKKLTSEKFKIAILANRPDREWNFGIKERVIVDGREVDGDSYWVDNGWFDNNGPYWNKTNSSVYTGEDKDVKDVFDLHHCQYDPIYDGKNYYTSSNYPEGTNRITRNKNFYGCVTGAKQGDLPYMGASVAWVEWSDAGDDVRDDKGWDLKIGRIPNTDKPIPMYGIQEFEAIGEWKKGSTYDLVAENEEHDYKPISMLRSAVKLELFVPAGSVEAVTLFYSNIYSRCEPMDVWTPTNEIWGNNEKEHELLCDMGRIQKNIGRMCTGYDLTGNTLASVTYGRKVYQERLSRLYGIWRKAGKWSFYTDEGLSGFPDCDTPPNSDGTYSTPYTSINNFFDSKYGGFSDEEFVRVFNPCTQRNTTIYINKCTKGCNSHNGKLYDHYVVYTGERNINDPSNLGQLGNNGPGNPTVIYWCMIDTKKGTTYSMPIMDYDAEGIDDILNTQIIRKGVLDSGKPANGGMALESQANNTVKVSGTGMGTYAIAVQCGFTEKQLDPTPGNLTTSNGIYRDFQNFEDPKYWPLPLIRNHVYRLILTGGSNGAKTRTGESDMNFSVHFEEMHTKDIGFK